MFWVRFSVAVVMVVSRWSASVAAEVSLVSTSPRHSCLYAKKFALLGLMVGVSAKKFALRTKNGTKSAFYGPLGESFCGLSGGEGVLGELCRVCRYGSHVSQVRWRPTCKKWWGVLHYMKPSGCVSSACRTLA